MSQTTRMEQSFTIKLQNPHQVIIHSQFTLASPASIATLAFNVCAGRPLILIKQLFNYRFELRNAKAASVARDANETDSNNPRLSEFLAKSKQRIRGVFAAEE